MLNAVQPESYVPPHKHLQKVEVFLVLKGKFLVLEYDDGGTVIENCILAVNKKNKGVEIPKNTWHSFNALEKDSVVYEIIDGPYVAETHKIFRSWAPLEENYDEGIKFIDNIKKKIL